MLLQVTGSSSAPLQPSADGDAAPMLSKLQSGNLTGFLHTLQRKYNFETLGGRADATVRSDKFESMQ